MNEIQTIAQTFNPGDVVYTVHLHDLDYEAEGECTVEVRATWRGHYWGRVYLGGVQACYLMEPGGFKNDVYYPDMKSEAYALLLETLDSHGWERVAR